MTDGRTAIAIFARAPVPGAAKTRLIPRLGPERAAALHAALVEHAIQCAIAADVGPITVWRPPGDEHSFFEQCVGLYSVGLAAQSGPDLGARMLSAFEATEGPLLLMGADAPSVTPQDLRDCARALAQGADAVFLPAADGGYALVGAATPHPAIFLDMQWGHERVMAQTRARLEAQGLTWREPRTVWDVDRPEDYDRLIAENTVGDLWRA